MLLIPLLKAKHHVVDIVVGGIVRRALGSVLFYHNLSNVFLPRDLRWSVRLRIGQSSEVPNDVSVPLACGPQQQVGATARPAPPLLADLRSASVSGHARGQRVQDRVDQVRHAPHAQQRCVDGRPAQQHRRGVHLRTGVRPGLPQTAGGDQGAFRGVLP